VRAFGTPSAEGRSARVRPDEVGRPAQVPRPLATLPSGPRVPPQLAMSSRRSLPAHGPNPERASSRLTPHAREGDPGAFKFKQSTKTNTKVLSISHSDRLCEVFGLDRQSMTEANYPAVSMLSLSYPDNTCFINPIHESPGDFWHRIPAMYESSFIVREGGLMSYGPTCEDGFQEAARYIDRIFKGAKPTDLPAVQPTRYYLAVNLKTGETLGLTIPQSLLLRADQVIE